MSTTDRITILDSRREITDRLGQTVVLGNSVGGTALNAPCIVSGDFGSSSQATAVMDVDATASVEFQNASFGIWSVFWDIDTASLLTNNGAAIAASRFNDIATNSLIWGADAMLLNIRVFTTTQTYTPTTGTAKVVVVCLGGGGGGAGAPATTANTACGGGGGAGALATGIITSGFSGVTITIGAGGAGGAAGFNSGSAGGATSFGSVLIGGAGNGGGPAGPSTGPFSGTGGTGGAASGTSSLFGANGESGWIGISYMGGNLSEGGRGGSTIYGCGGIQRLQNSSSSAGLAGTGFGTGGSGAAVGGTSAAAAGGAGTAGICIVYEYNA